MRIPENPRQNGAAIREIRVREGWTVDGLANEVTKRNKHKGVSLSGPHLRNIENELREAKPEVLAALAEILDCKIAALRGYRDPSMLRRAS